MKNVVDHRILIPRPTATVWQYLSDLSNNVYWQTDCEAVSFLTSRRNGVGVRWRCRAPNGHESVIETTAWYEGLGYEYSFIDSGAFDENRGRIRLQEIAEGTVVQWTFSYDTKGLIGGLRNTLSLRRQTEAAMIDSLRMLFRKLGQTTSEPVWEAKSLIREAPGYEERSRYKPRHPSKMDTEALAEKAPEISPTPVIEEPPIAEEDTRPSVKAAPPEPDFLAQVDEASDEADAAWKRPVPEETAPTQQDVPVAPPEPAVVIVASEPEQLDEAPPTFVESAVVLILARSDEAPPVEASEPVRTEAPLIEPVEAEPQALEVVVPMLDEPALPVEQTTRLHEKPVVVEASVDDKSVEPAVSTLTPVSQLEPVPPEELAKMDTREISVFDLFGIPKPSETTELRAVAAPVVAPVTVVEMPVVAGGRIGLRVMQRRKLVKLRRPT